MMRLNLTTVATLFGSVFLSLTPLCLGQAQTHKARNHVPAITFHFRPETLNGVHAMHVEVSFRTHHSTTSLEIPSSFGGASDLHEDFLNLRIISQEASISGMDSIGSTVISAPSERWVRFEYDLVPQLVKVFLHPAEHHAVVTKEYFLFNTDNALIHPVFSPRDHVSATFTFSGFPRQQRLVSSFGIGRATTHVVMPWFRLQNALFGGGDFRLSSSKVNDTHIVLAARGEWRFSDADALAEIGKVIATENQFWGTGLPFFLVTLAPFDAEEGHNDGSGFMDAFMLFLSRKDRLDVSVITLLAHEMFHHWNPMSMGQPISDEVAQWFTEGFTTYYAGVLSSRSGLISNEGYVEYLNRWLRRYQLSPMKNVSQPEWAKESHASGFGYELPYSRGLAFALWADSAIRTRSCGKASLDDVMRRLVAEAQPADDPPPLTEERVLEAFEGYLSADQMSELRSMVNAGATVELPRAGPAACTSLATTPVQVVEPGFALSSLTTKRMSGVEESGPAYKAGIRDGQEVYRSSFWREDPTKEVILGVIVSGEKKLIHFSSAKTVDILQYRHASDCGGAQ